MTSLDGLPRTLSRAQPMDALSSQSNVAGDKAALVRRGHVRQVLPYADHGGGDRPARQGAGARRLAARLRRSAPRRLGAVVSGYDVRPASKGEVKSLGATFVELTSVEAGAGEGGYARELTAEERQAQQEELTGHIAGTTW